MKNPQIRKRKIIAILCIQLFILGFFIQCKTNQSSMNYGTLVRQNQNKSLKMKFTKPTYLKKGDTIMIVAPAGFVPDSTEIEPGIALAKSWGLEVIVGNNAFKKHNHFAGTDAERQSDLQIFRSKWTIQTLKPFGVPEVVMERFVLLTKLILQLSSSIQNGLLVFRTLPLCILPFTILVLLRFTLQCQAE